ncbi:MAG: potassium channel protein [Eubacterium sp.]|nr:potassium channel protein [Eubacterium sp.]
MDTTNEVFNEHDNYNCYDDTTPEYYLLYDYIRLVRALIEEINDTRDDVLRWRQAIIKYLPERWAEGLRCDMLSNLCRNFEDFDAYKHYMNSYCGGVDPLDNEGVCQRVHRLITGTDETSINYL